MVLLQSLDHWSMLCARKGRPYDYAVNGLSITFQNLDVLTDIWPIAISEFYFAAGTTINRFTSKVKTEPDRNGLFSVWIDVCHPTTARYKCHSIKIHLDCAYVFQTRRSATW